MSGRRWAGGAALVALAGLLAGCFALPSGPIPTRAPDTAGVDAALLPYYSQTLEWSSCEGGAFDCTMVTAPRDWSAPGADDIELAVIRHRASSGEAIGSLLTNPGGPGVSGYDFVRDGLASLVTQPLSDAFDVVGFDPRGVERTAPVECFDAAGMDSYLYGIATGPRGSQERAEQKDVANREFAAACEANSGGILPYVSTANTARDLDLLRGVLGDASLNYLGYSWGTALGTAYARLFPERVGRMVLDGAMDPSVPSSDVGAAQAVGFQNALDAFLADCATRAECPYRGTADEMSSDIDALLARIDRRPLAGADGRELGADTLLTAILQTLYSQQSWASLRVILAQVEKGESTTAFAMADAYNGRSADGTYAANTTEAFTAFNCMDYPSDGQDVVDAAQARLDVEAPTFAPYWFGSDVCEDWPAAPTGVRERVEVTAASPIVIVGTTGDPATPYDWAVSLSEQLAPSVLITRVGEGHTGFNKGNACVDDAVESYLLSGTAPESALRCE